MLLPLEVMVRSPPVAASPPLSDSVGVSPVLQVMVTAPVPSAPNTVPLMTLVKSA